MMLILECINKILRKKVFVLNVKKDNMKVIFLKQNKKIKINTCQQKKLK
jgi:hypothetical protein